MPLDATVGGVNANSYNTREEFTTFLNERLHVTDAQKAATDAQKDGALILGASWLESQLCFQGTATFLGQALWFPRTGLTNRNGYPIDPETIPNEIKQLQNELALLALSGDRSRENAAAAAGLKSLKAGPVALEFKDELKVEVIPATLKAFVPTSWLCEVEPTGELIFRAL